MWQLLFQFATGVTDSDSGEDSSELSLSESLTLNLEAAAADFFSWSMEEIFAVV